MKQDIHANENSKNAGNAHINTIIADIQLQNAQLLFCFDEWWHSCERIEKIMDAPIIQFKD